MNRLRHSAPYSDLVLGTCPRLGEWCAIRLVTVPQVITLPLILPSEHTFLIHEDKKPSTFCSVKYSAIGFACGMSMPRKTVSSIFGCPLSVNSLGCHPRLLSLSPICLRLPTLKRVTLSFNRLPVFSEIRSSTIGGNTACNSSVIVAILSATSACKTVALSKSKLKPLRSCLLMWTATSCSSCIAFS